MKLSERMNENVLEELFQRDPKKKRFTIREVMITPFDMTKGQPLDDSGDIHYIYQLRLVTKVIWKPAPYAIISIGNIESSEFKTIVMNTTDQSSLELKVIEVVRELFRDSKFQNEITRGVLEAYSDYLKTIQKIYL